MTRSSGGASGQAPWRAVDGGVLLAVRLTPRAARDGVDGIAADDKPLLKIRLTAPPVEGKANAHLMAFLAKAFGVSKSQVSLIGGELNRQKRVRICSPKKLPDLPDLTRPA